MRKEIRVHTQKTPLLQRLIIGSVLSGLLLGFGGFVTNISTAQAHPTQINVQHPGGPTYAQKNAPPYNDYRYNRNRRYWERYDRNRHGWYRYDRQRHRFY